MIDSSTNRPGAELPNPGAHLRARPLLTILEVCDRLPGKRGRRVHPSTVTRWILTGCPARSGTRVRLAATRCGSRWVVDPADLDTFFTALAAYPQTPTTPAPALNRTDAQTRAARASDALARRGA